MPTYNTYNRANGSIGNVYNLPVASSDNCNIPQDHAQLHDHALLDKADFLPNSGKFLIIKFQKKFLSGRGIFFKILFFDDSDKYLILFRFWAFFKLKFYLYLPIFHEFFLIIGPMTKYGAMISKGLKWWSQFQSANNWS